MLEINLEPFPVLYSDRLVLRRITKSDVNEIFQLRSNEEVMKYIDLPIMKTIEEAYEKVIFFDDLLAKKEAINWAICLKENKKQVGFILLKKLDATNHRAEVGYILHPDFWRKGIIQEALNSVLDFAFNILNFHSIEAIINPANLASEKILEKNGFVKEAHFKENFYFEGKFLDSGVYSLLKSNYKNQQ